MKVQNMMQRNRFIKHWKGFFTQIYLKSLYLKREKESPMLIILKLVCNLSVFLFNKYDNIFMYEKMLEKFTLSNIKSHEKRIN